MRSSTTTIAFVLMLLVVTPVPARAEEDDFWGDFFQGFFVSEVVDAVTEATAAPTKVSLREEAEAEGDPPPPSMLGGLLLIGHTGPFRLPDRHRPDAMGVVCRDHIFCPLKGGKGKAALSVTLIKNDF